MIVTHARKKRQRKCGEQDGREKKRVIIHTESDRNEINLICHNYISVLVRSPLGANQRYFHSAHDASIVAMAPRINILTHWVQHRSLSMSFAIATENPMSPTHSQTTALIKTMLVYRLQSKLVCGCSSIDTTQFLQIRR